MTIQELIVKLEECRSNMDGLNDDMARDTHDTLNQLIYDIVGDYNYPICFNFPLGHNSDNYPIIIGAEGHLDINDSGSTFNYIK